MIAIMLPLQLKFGAEKNRIVIALVGGGIFVIGYFGSRLMPEGLQVPAFILEMQDSTMLLLLSVVSLAALVISYMCSLHVMEHKEY